MLYRKIMSLLKSSDPNNDNLLQLRTDILKSYEQLNSEVLENTNAWIEYLSNHENYLQQYKALCHQIFKVQPVIQAREEIVALIFYNNFNDLKGKRINKNYYRANLSALMIFSNEVIDKILKYLFNEIIPPWKIHLFSLVVKSGSSSLVKYVLYTMRCSLNDNQNSLHNKTKIQYRPLIISLLEDSLTLINDYHQNIEYNND